MTTKGAEMMKEIHQDVLSIGKQALDLKARCEALELALRVEREAANLYAKQVAHWIGKHDALLEQQLKAAPQAPAPLTEGYKRGYMVALSDAEEAIDDECRERVVTASDCIELIRNLGEVP